MHNSLKKMVKHKKNRNCQDFLQVHRINNFKLIIILIMKKINKMNNFHKQIKLFNLNLQEKVVALRIIIMKM